MTFGTIGTLLHDPSRAASQADAVIETARRLGAGLRIVALEVFASDPGFAFAGLGQANRPDDAPADSSACDSIRHAVEPRLVSGGMAASASVHCVRTPQVALSQVVQEQMRFCDLVVQDRPFGLTRLEIEAVTAQTTLFALRLPLLILPHSLPLAHADAKVMLAWDDSAAALNAVRVALPLLQRAAAVHIAMIDPPRDAADRSDPGGKLVRFLAEHDVTCDVMVMGREQPNTGQELLRRARDAKCDLLVMGAYGHSRLRQAVFGGTTRYVLSHADMPVLMAH